MQYLYAFLAVFVVLALVAIGFNTDVLVKNTKQICNELARIADALDEQNREKNNK